ncbi:MAG: YicC family protein [Methyloligellaceae bacterium]
MTGFARVDGAAANYSWHWEIRTVNGRGLDVRMRLAPGFESLEQEVRAICKEKLSRGNCSITLTVRAEAGTLAIQLNEELFEQVLSAARRASDLAESPMPDIDVLLTIKGVLETREAEADEAEMEAIRRQMLVDFAKAVDDVVAMRAEEGARLAQTLAQLVDDIEAVSARIAASPARTPEAISARLREQVARLLQEAPALDEQRLYQEAVLLATKADIHEELERLKAHVAAARDLLKSDEPIGRRLDFLTQEFNREANTICSKSNDTAVSQAGLELKAVIDQMREQVQNIE